MKQYLFIIKEIRKGKSVTRAFLNLRLKNEEIKGRTIDIGGGNNSEYISFMNRHDSVDFTNFDIKDGALVDFEKDKLPSEDNQYDTVIFLNVLEHIFNYQHIVNEIIRITKPGGKIIGFVPFLMWYHPDHHDFFRYTHEALKKIIQEAGGKDFEIESISRGPFTASAQMILASTPAFLRVPIYTCFHMLDSCFLKLRPTHGDKYALGYYFVLKYEYHD
jgi:SAM-dependent methyltransferase